ncbi:MAG TPA: hypothetical protein VKF37_05555 [Chloroflexota bacterium]|nr:hypothetical protein [Chloroflexota bacterium]
MNMVQVGDHVRLKVLPSWVGQLPPESQDVFRLCVGKTFRVREINEHGHVELWVHDGVDEPRIAAADIILIDPEDVDVVTNAHQP